MYGRVLYYTIHYYWSVQGKGGNGAETYATVRVPIPYRYHTPCIGNFYFFSITVPQLFSRLQTDDGFESTLEM
jgi:hypothetical protein